MIRNNNDDKVPVPCGKCPQCTARRTSAWSFRLMQQDKIATSSMFLTLTYDTKHVPITERGFMTLSKRDLQLFFKRLRKAHGKNSKTIKYYVAGEYGGKTKRPHYHLILFNADVNYINASWNKGEFHIGDVTGASVGYTLKYISKPRTVPVHRNDDRVPEFSLMSKALGVNYLSDAIKNWHKADLTERMYCNIEDGKKISMPRYYKDKIYNEQERDKVKRVQQERINAKTAEDISKFPSLDAYNDYKFHGMIAALSDQLTKHTKNDKL